MIKVLALIGRLLDSPSIELCEHRKELVDVMRTSEHLPEDIRYHLADVIDVELSRDIYELQSRYDSLFERGRTLSLLLFEHVHGESRERGSAMIDLLDVYFDAGLRPTEKELPDYLPLFLEFLSTLDEDKATNWLHDIGHILLLLAERLRKREAWEAELFDALIIIGGAPREDADLTQKVQAEEDDSTLEALDEAWEDKEIRFDQAMDSTDACPTSASVVQQRAQKYADLDKHIGLSPEQIASLQQNRII